MAAKTSVADWPTERWIYIGRRALTGGLLGKFFLDENGNELAYKKANANIVGHTYEVCVMRDRDGGGVRAATNTMKLLTDVQRDPRHADWQLEDRAAYEADQQRKAENRLAKEAGDLGAITLAEVRRRVYLSPSMQRTGLIAAVIAYITAGHGA